MKVAVTGATEVIGTAAVRALVGAGHDVVGARAHLRARRPPRGARRDAVPGGPLRPRVAARDVRRLRRRVQPRHAHPGRPRRAALPGLARERPAAHRGGASRGRHRPGNRGAPAGAGERVVPLRRRRRRLDRRGQPARHQPRHRAGVGGGSRTRRGSGPRCGRAWCSASARSSATTTSPAGSCVRRAAGCRSVSGRPPAGPISCTLTTSAPRSWRRCAPASGTYNVGAEPTRREDQSRGTPGGRPPYDVHASRSPAPGRLPARAAYPVAACVNSEHFTAQTVGPHDGPFDPSWFDVVGLESACP